MMETRDIRRAATTDKAQVLADLRTAMGTGPYRQDAHAVIIGIDRYADPGIRNLQYAGADAEAMRAALVDPEVGRFDPEHVTLLVDDRATRTEILKAIGALRRRVREEDTVVIYFAGHGAPEIDTAGTVGGDGFQKFLVPHDAQMTELYATAIPMDEIQRIFGRIISRSLVFLLDACYSGNAGGRSFARTDLATRSMNLSAKFLEDIAGEGRCVITSCDVNEVSVESKDFGHGLFTYYLLQGMRGAADTNGNGAVDVDELYRYVCAQVRDEAQRAGAKMQPVLTGQMRGSVVLTMPETPALRRARELRAEAAPLEAAGDVDGAEARWREAASLDPADVTAPAALTAIVERRAAAQRIQEAAEQARAAELQQRVEVLRGHFARGELSESLFAYVIDVLQADPATLQGDDQLLRRLVDALLAGTLSIERFVKSASVVARSRSSTAHPVVSAQPPAVRVPPPNTPTGVPRPSASPAMAAPVTAAPVMATRSLASPAAVAAPAAPAASPGITPPVAPLVAPPAAPSGGSRWRRNAAIAAAAVVLVLVGLYKLGGSEADGGGSAPAAATDSAVTLTSDSLRALTERGIALYDSARYDEALPLLEAAGNAHDARASYYLGLMYDNGQGVTTSDSAAMEWFKWSADAGDSTAMTAVGIMYQDGEGVAASDSAAMAWYARAAEAGDPSAMRYLAIMYEEGRGVRRSERTATEWYRRAAEAGDSIAKVWVRRAPSP